MTSQAIEKAPRQSQQKAPIGTKGSNAHYTTTGVIGGNSAGPAKGWEAIEPNHHNKPLFLIEAQAASDEAWNDYLWLVDTLERSGKWDPGSVTEAWDRYEAAERKAKVCYQAFCDGFDYEPIPF